MRHFLGIWPLGQGSGKGSPQGVEEASLISKIKTARSCLTTTGYRSQAGSVILSLGTNLRRSYYLSHSTHGETEVPLDEMRTSAGGRWGEY